MRKISERALRPRFSSYLGAALRLALRKYFRSGAPACAPAFRIFRSGAPGALRRILKERRSPTCAPTFLPLFAKKVFKILLKIVSSGKYMQIYKKYPEANENNVSGKVSGTWENRGKNLIVQKL